MDNDFVDAPPLSGSPTKSPTVAVTGSPTKAPALAPGASMTSMISGVVKADDGTLLEDVLITLMGDGVEYTTRTGSDGYYEFTELAAGEYTVVETNPLEYPENVSNRDESPDGDVADSDTAVNNKIGVTLNAGEHDENNNFVDSKLAPGSISLHSLPCDGGEGYGLLTLLE